MVSFVTSTLNKIYPVLETLGLFLHYQIPENWYETIDPSPMLLPLTSVIAPPPMLLPLHRCYCFSTDVIAPPPMLLTPHRCYCPSTNVIAPPTMLLTPHRCYCPSAVCYNTSTVTISYGCSTWIRYQNSAKKV
jgi:hypothetical protein